MTDPHASSVLDRVLPRLKGAVLLFAATYLLAIERLSPHPLPGLGWLGVALLLAGGVDMLAHGARFRRLQRVLCVALVASGAFAVILAVHPAKHAVAARDR